MILAIFQFDFESCTIAKSTKVRHFKKILGLPCNFMVPMGPMVALSTGMKWSL